MRLVTFCTKTKQVQRALGITLGSRWIVDLGLASLAGEFVVQADRERLFGDTVAFLRAGAEARDLARQVENWTRGETEGDHAAAPWLHARSEVCWLPPVPHPPKLIATGQNFIAHLLEGNTGRIARGEAPYPIPTTPFSFIKVASTLAGHEEQIQYPPHTRELDYEGEVGVVIGQRGRDLAPSEAMSIVAGYVILNDLSARDIQREEMKAGLLNLGKNLPGFCPMGPELVLTDEVSDPTDLQIKTWVNDELRQNGTTAEMHFSWADLISYWSQMGLEPGDIITSGTPRGVAMGHGPEWYLRPGDVVTVEVAGLGRLSNQIVQGGAV